MMNLCIMHSATDKYSCHGFIALFLYLAGVVNHICLSANQTDMRMSFYIHIQCTLTTRCPLPCHLVKLRAACVVLRALGASALATAPW